MLETFLRTIFRYHWRNKSFALINIFGFAVGLASCLLIGLYVFEEFSYDRFHEKADQIYRVVISHTNSGEVRAVIPGPLMAQAKDDIPEVLDMARHVWYWVPKIGRLNETNPEDESGLIRAKMRFVDPGFMRMFSFEVLRGDPNGLETPAGIILTETTANKIFGDEDPLGQPLNIPVYPEAHVVAIVADPPKQSHLQFDGLMPVDVSLNEYWWDHWNRESMNGYLLLQEGADVDAVAQKMLGFMNEHHDEGSQIPVLQPLPDVHLGSSHVAYDGLNTDKNDATRVYVLFVIAVMILLIAAFNFINLSCAQAAKRAREVGIRKVAGAGIIHLRTQFLVESIIMTMIATCIALVVLQIALPYMDVFLGKSVAFSLLDQPFLILYLFGIAVVIGLITGLYPAVLLSRFMPASVLKGELASGRRGTGLRRVFVTAQFAISVALIFCALVVTGQVRFMMNRDVGFNRDRIVAINPEKNSRLFRNELLSVPSALSVGCVYRLPGSSLYRHPIIPEGSDFDSRIGADQLWIDEGFVATLGVNITQGRTFAPDPPEDQAFEVMVNETLWQQLQRDLGWDSPIGRTLDFRDEPDGESDRAEIIGVVDDILWGSAKKVCLPMVIEYAQDWARFVLVKIPENNIDGALADLEAKFNEVFPGEAYRMEFLDESFGAQFQTEKQFGAEVGVFSSLAIIVACMGLLGLATFATQQRRREIAVRKVLGSGTARIVNMLLSDFMKLIAIGMVIAWPVAYYFMDNWLNNFAHKVTLDHWPFILSGVAVLVMALLTVSTQSWQAARTNPVDALRRES